MLCKNALEAWGNPYITVMDLETRSVVGPITHSLKNCSGQMTVDCVHALYDFNYTPLSTDENTFGIGSLRCLESCFPIFSMSLYSCTCTLHIFRFQS